MGAPIVNDDRQKIHSSADDFRKQKLLTWMVLMLVVIGGALPRLNHIDKGIWTPEAWVANSVLAETMGQMFHYKDWLQTSPPLFLLLVRSTTRLAGISVASLRAVPFTLSMLSLVMIAWLAQKLLRTPFAVICAALVALSPPAVVFSKEVKQFSGDVAAGCLMLLVCWRYLEQPDRRRYMLLCAGLTIALFLSYPAVTFVPVAIVLIAAKPSTGDATPSSDRRRRFQRASILATLGACICVVNYWFFIKPNSSPLLTDYWKDGYPQFHSLKTILPFYLRYFLGMGVYFYLPISSKDFLSSTFSFHGAGLAVLLLIAAIVALASFAPLWRNKRHVRAVVLCLGPCLCLAVLNALHLYPVNSRRLTLFLVPCVSLVIAVILQNLSDMLFVRMHRSTASRVSIGITAGCILVLFLASTHSDQWSNYWFEDEDTAGALSYLRAKASPEDTIYVHASIEEPAKLYFRLLKWSPPDLRFGKTGRVCCTRTPEPVLMSSASRQEYVLHDFERVISEKPVVRLWLLSTGRQNHWGYLDRNELEIIDRRLVEIGCQKVSEKHFAFETLQQFGCAEARLLSEN